MAKGSSSEDRLRWGRGSSRTNSRVGEWLVVIFCFGALAFSPLVIGIFDRGAGVSVLGFPILYFYLFSAWALLIAAIILVMESLGEGGGGRPPAEQRRQRPRSEAR